MTRRAKAAKAAALAATVTAATLALGVASPAAAQRFEQRLTHSAAACQGNGPAVLLTVSNIRSSAGTMRVQLYRALASEWLERGRYLHRIELPAQAGTMSICMPVPEPGAYAIAIRHDVNDNNQTDISRDGGGMSNNPSINIFNLGRPAIERTRFSIGREVLPMSIRMRYL